MKLFLFNDIIPNPISNKEIIVALKNTIVEYKILKEKYPEHEFALIMGSDNLENISKWKNAAILLRDYPFYVYPRPGFVPSEQFENINIIEAPLMEISSTLIRTAIKENKNIKPMLPPKVWEYLDGSNLYG